MAAALLPLPALAGSLYSTPRYAAILIDHDSGELLYARRADETRYPASITKVMTLYVAFEELTAGRLQLDDKIRISRHAFGQAPSKLGLRPGATISVRDAFGVIATKSANDIAVALAEHISGSEAEFAARMTQTARRLGMKASVFHNASGLPHAAAGVWLGFAAPFLHVTFGHGEYSLEKVPRSVPAPDRFPPPPLQRGRGRRLRCLHLARWAGPSAAGQWRHPRR
jgi:hypothetical protein